MNRKKEGALVSKIRTPLSEPAALPEADQEAQFPVVGIGASAGGLAAIKAFYSAMPTDAGPGMAFVLVQHLSPDHESILADLVKRCTRLEVRKVEDGMVVRPNCAYVIPPNCDMAFLNGTLQLLEPGAPRELRLPIDFLFRSLARDLRERAICIVLSGTGSDGTLGVREVKGEGGLVTAQTPESTEFDGMPRSAIATGLVDYVLPPAEMPARLIAYTAHAFGKRRGQAARPHLNEEDALKKIRIVLRDRLPRWTDGATAAVLRGETPKLVRGSETVLLVEDEAPILTLGRTLLKREGYRVLPARTPAKHSSSLRRSRGRSTFSPPMWSCLA